MPITAAQCRAARGLLSWSQTDLATEAKVSRATVTSFEADKRTPIENNLNALQTALEVAGIEFIPENGGGAGVRLRDRTDPRSYFPFPIFEVEMPFGKGRFGVYRNDRSFNHWYRLVLILLTNPHRQFSDAYELEGFWIDALNSGDCLETILNEALKLVSGPRKPDHPSKLSWGLNQPAHVYPNAREFLADLKIDWKQKPAQIVGCNSNFSNPGQSVRSLTQIPLGPLDWWRLDQM